jgi:hypothetical protein
MAGFFYSSTNRELEALCYKVSSSVGTYPHEKTMTKTN